MTQKKRRTQFDIMRPLFECIRSNPELTSTQRLLLIALYDRMDGNGVCFPSYTDIAQFTGLSRQSISNNIKALVSSGWITYQQGNKARSQSNTYQLNLEKLGLEVKQESIVVPINMNKFIAPDGSTWDAPIDYWMWKKSQKN